jgi:superfamily II DNA/RNA helicase
MPIRNYSADKKTPQRSGAPKQGSKSPNHRGYHADAAPAKKRWNADDRAKRTGDRPTDGDRRPNWEPTAERRSERPAYGDRSQRTERPSYGDRTQRSGRTPERPAYARTERPSYNDRTERPAYGDRAKRDDRPARTERPSYNDRAPRTERPSHDRPRAERPAYGDRPARTERPSYNDRPARTERPSYNDRAPRTERPSYDRPRAERPAYNDRPSHGDRAERPSRDRAERPAYQDRRAERPQRSFDDRPQRRSSDLYPSRDRKPDYSQEDVVLEKLEARTITAADAEGVTWPSLGIGDNMTRQLISMGAEAPFPIQAATIPDVLSGRDVLGRGRTGSGKTIAFGAPLVERLMENNGGKDRKPGRSPRALILAPTRELAQQIDRTVQPIARSVGLFTTTIVGGVPQYKQVASLQRGVDIVIATPGRVEDLVEQGKLDLSNVMVTVLDEADHMCDLGFLEPVQRILDETKQGGQKLLFSATLDKGVATLVKQYLKDPAVHEVAGEDQASSTIDHRVLLIEQRDKAAIIEQLAAGDGKTLVFARTRAFAEMLADQLEDAGIPATSLHGDLNQSRRTRNLQLLTSGRVKVLVATDVAARGIHVDDISLVIQADAPDEYKTYLHRSGRTGRAGKVGTVVTLISKARRRRMDELLERAEIDVKFEQVAPGDAVLEELAAL